MKNILIIIALILLSGCKTKQITITKTEFVYDTIVQKEFVHDTILKTKTVIINTPVSNSFEIDSPCDSITGVLNDFKQSFSSGSVDVSIIAKDGKLTIESSIDSIKQVAVEEYKTSIKEIIDKTSKNSSKELIIDTKIIKRKPCWGLIIYSILITVFLFRKQLFNIVSKIYPPLKSVKFLMKLFS